MTTIAPSVSWDGTTSWGGRTIPTESGTPYGSGWTQKPSSAAFDTPPYIWWDDDFEVCVAAGHGDSAWIDHVEFWLEGSTATVSSVTISARTGVQGWCVTVQPPAGTDGNCQLYATVVPVNGYERLIGPLSLHFNKGGSITTTVKTIKASGGDYTSLGAGALDMTNDGTRWVFKYDAGTWTEDAEQYLNLTTLTYPCEVRPADGLSLGDVVVQRSTRYVFRALKSSPYVFYDIEVLAENIQQWYDALYRTFVNCRFTDSNGLMFVPNYGGSTPLASFFRSDEGQRTYLDGCTLTMPQCTGWQWACNTTISYSADAWSIQGSHANFATDIACLNTTMTRNDVYRSSAGPFTVASATYDGGTGRTTIVWSGSPSLWEKSSGTPNTGEAVLFIDGTLSGQEFETYTQVDSTDTTVVEGDASAAAASDTAWHLAGEYHADTMQFFPSSIDYTNIHVQGLRTYGAGYQCWLFQTGNGYEINGLTMQLCIFHETGPGADLSQWQFGHTNICIRSITMIGQTTEFETQYVGFTTTDIVVQDSIIENFDVSPYGADFLDTGDGVYIDNCHFISGTQRGTNGTGPSDPLLDASYVPGSGSACLSRVASPVLPYDYYGNTFGTGAAVGAVSGAQSTTGGKVLL